MAGRPMATGAKPPLEIHAFEQDGFQAARLGLGDEHAVADSGPGRLRLAWREIEDNETFFRVAGDIQAGLERKISCLSSATANSKKASPAAFGGAGIVARAHRSAFVKREISSSR